MDEAESNDKADEDRLFPVPEHPSHDRVWTVQTSKLSIVIPSIGRGSLSMLIDSLERHGADWIHEIIVVLDPAFSQPSPGSCGESRRLPLLFVRSPGPGVNRARNYGGGLAQSALIAFLDDDVELESSRFFEETARLFCRPTVVAVGGDYGTADGTDLWGHGYNSLCSVWRASAGQSPAAMLLGGCMVVRRDVWTAAGGFDESIIYGGSEAPLICNLRSAYGEVVYSSNLRVTHRTHGRGLVHWLWVAFRQGRAKEQTSSQLPSFRRRLTLTVEAMNELSTKGVWAFLVFTPVFLLSSRCGSLCAALKLFPSSGHPRRPKVHSDC